MPRERAPRPRGRTTVILPPPSDGHRDAYSRYAYGYYPWGFGGLGFGDYYDGFYDPWSQGGYQVYGPDQGEGPGGMSSSLYAGSLHLKLKPRDAQVFVDGYYAGVVDDFDGIFQGLRLEAGPHRIELRAPGYESARFDVQIAPDRKTTYRGDLAPVR